MVVDVRERRAVLLRRLRVLFPWREVVVPWLVSRIYSSALIAAFATFGYKPLPGVELGSGFDKWDGQWYLLIARHGYGPPPTDGVQTGWPFFPLFPGTIRALGELGLPDRASILVLNQLVFLLAVAGVWRIARRHTSDGAARLAVWSIALFPGAFMFSMLYPSSIFLAATVWAFVLVEERHDLVASALVAVTALVRPNGIVLAVALVVAVRSWRRAAVLCGPAIVAVATWASICWYLVGDPIVYLSAKEEWPEVTVKGFLLAPQDHDYVFPHVMLAVAALVALFLVRKRLPLSWMVFTILYLAPSLGLGMVGLGRYANECFPPFVAAGELLHRARRWFRALAFTLAVLGQAACTWWVVHNHYVP
jgi:branched-subunit amino acid transport protein AzlD